MATIMTDEDDNLTLGFDLKILGKGIYELCGLV